MKPLPQDKEKYTDLLLAKTRALRNILIILVLVLFVYYVGGSFPEWPQAVEKSDTQKTQEVLPEIVDGIHVSSGLIADNGFETVASHCGNCHSLKLVTQNRANREGWKSIIEWMQKTQNLWDLGDQEDVILDYLAKNYAPEEAGRRKNLSNIDWYELEE